MGPELRIGIIGDFDSENPNHFATEESLRHVNSIQERVLEIDWLETDQLLEDWDQQAQRYHGIWCTNGGPFRSLDGTLKCIQFARETGIPLLGTCSGFQHLALEYARHVLQYPEAQHAEYDSTAKLLLIDKLSCSMVNQTGSIQLSPGSKTQECYQQEIIEERYFCNYGLNHAYAHFFKDCGLKIVGIDQEQAIQVLESADESFWVGTAFTPQVNSKPGHPHPLIAAFLNAAASVAQVSYT